MPSLFEQIGGKGGRIDRLANRLIWKFAGPRRALETDAPLVSFTFDDVPDSALHEGAAILERHGVRGTFYIAGGLAGQVEPERVLIGPEGCRELAERGHEVGCHTFSHRRVRDMPRAELAGDLDRNAAYLAGTGIVAPPVNFAFPYNAAWPPARSEFRRRFRSCRGAGEAINRGRVDPLMLQAVEIRQPEEEARALTGWIDEVARTPGWLVFFTHDIAARPTQYGCTPQTFDRLVAHAVARGCAVLPVDRALDRLGW
ncbi:MAG: polysaccharide deacetylase [Stutzerimonas stutzeri]|uniref:Chitooligosaccharide deacetylase n=1 Tax=Bosea eneae TaxID=151454 RepID=A0ABW0IT42_9HYPH|nr:MAG: polysaccharide deacetylase [Stutzerimonas stutzeri]